MEKKKAPILYRGAFLSLKGAFLILAAVMLAAILVALALIDDVRMADKTVKNIELVTLTDGAPVNAEIFRESKLTVINVWATYCGPCIREMPEFGEVARAYADRGVRFIGICGDIPYDADGSPNAAQMREAFAIIEQTGADYLHCMPTQAYAPSLNALVSSAYPGTFLVDASGNIRKLFVGAVSKDVLISALEKELPASQGGGKKAGE